MSLSALVLLCAAGCDGSITGEPEQQPPPPEPVDAGTTPVALTDEALYLSYCGSCHGPTGEGTATAYQVRSPVRAYATWVVRNGRHERSTYPDAMPSFTVTALPTDKLERIFDFLHSVPKPTDGQGLYVRYCGNCHGAQAEGGRADEGLVHKAWDEPEEIEEAVRDGHGRTNFDDAEEYMPRWGAAELNDTEIAAMTTWLLTFPDPGDD